MQSPAFVSGSTSNSKATNIGKESSVCSGLNRNCQKNAMDGNSETVWHCNQAGPCFLKFDLGAPTTVTGFKLLTFENRIVSATLQASTNQLTWSDVTTFSVPSPSPGTPTTVLFSATNYRYWRLNSIKAKGTVWPAIKEAWFYANTAGCTSLCVWIKPSCFNWLLVCVTVINL